MEISRNEVWGQTRGGSPFEGFTDASNPGSCARALLLLLRLAGVRPTSRVDRCTLLLRALCAACVVSVGNPDVPS